jgi:hypothetical protein
MLAKRGVLGDFADIEQAVDPGGTSMHTLEVSVIWRPVLEAAAILAAAMCGVLLLVMYKLLFVLIAIIGLSTALIVERAERETDRKNQARLSRKPS